MRTIAALVLIAALSVPGPAGAAQSVGDTTFPETLRAGDRELVLSGAGLYRKFLFKVYANALYLPEPEAADSVLGETPRCLLFHYFREITPEQFAKAARNFLEKNLEPAELKAIQPKLDRMNAIYEPVSEGDRYTLCYLPGEGTTVALNDEHVGTVEGSRFADAYFRIWLGEESISDDLRDRLLGR